MRLKTLREILKTAPIKPKETARKRSHLNENVDDDGAISSEFVYISRFDQCYENQRVIEQIKKDIMAISKWADVARLIPLSQVALDVVCGLC